MQEETPNYVAVKRYQWQGVGRIGDPSLNLMPVLNGERVDNVRMHRT